MASEKLRLLPMGARVIVKKLQGNELSEHGIWIPESARGDGTLCEVVSICDEYELEGEDYVSLFKPGDMVIVGKHAGTSVQIGRDQCVILREADVLARAIREGEARDKQKVHE